MAGDDLVNKVWIAPGCTGCGICASIAPEAFAPVEGVCVVRREASDVEFVRSRSELILLAAAECPVEVIHVDAVRVAAGEEPESEAVSRRGVISAASTGALAFGGSVVLGGAALSRFMFPNVLEEADPRMGVGELAQYLEMPISSVSQAYKPQGIWIVRLDAAIAALTTVCTHLGCILNWVESQGKFKCPCHGSGFSPSGINLEGPAPRPLERFSISVENGIVVVDRSKTFRQEKGQWSNPESFIRV